MNTNDALVENRFCVVGCINLILDEMVLTIICDEAQYRMDEIDQIAIGIDVMDIIDRIDFSLAKIMNLNMFVIIMTTTVKLKTFNREQC